VVTVALVLVGVLVVTVALVSVAVVLSSTMLVAAIFGGVKAALAGTQILKLALAVLVAQG
jgi:hypothetical protein